MGPQKLVFKSEFSWWISSLHFRCFTYYDLHTWSLDAPNNILYYSLSRQPHFLPTLWYYKVPSIKWASWFIEVDDYYTIALISSKKLSPRRSDSRDFTVDSIHGDGCTRTAPLPRVNTHASMSAPPHVTYDISIKCSPKAPPQTASSSGFMPVISRQ